MSFLHAAEVPLLLKQKWVLLNEHFLLIKPLLVENWDRCGLLCSSIVEILFPFLLRNIIICLVMLTVFIVMVILAASFWPSGGWYLNAAESFFFYVSHHRTIRLVLIWSLFKNLRLINRPLLIQLSWGVWHTWILHCHGRGSAGVGVGVGIGFIGVDLHWLKLLFLIVILHSNLNVAIWIS